MAAGVDGEVPGSLDAAGAEWNERDTGGRTLLHAVAAHDVGDRTLWRCRFLMTKGVDPAAREMPRGGRRRMSLSRAGTRRWSRCWRVDKGLPCLPDRPGLDCRSRFPVCWVSG